MKKETVIGLCTMVVTLLLLYGLVSFAGASEDDSRTGCPYSSEGAGSDVVIHYIDSTSCVWCWMEAPVFKDILAQYNSTISLKKYDIYSCPIASEYGITATPGWVFDNGSEVVVQEGYLSYEQMESIICNLSEDC